MDLEADLRQLLLDELVEHTTHPDQLAALNTRALLAVYANWANRIPTAKPRTVHRARELDRLLRRNGALAADVRKVLIELESGVDISHRLSKDVEVAWVPPTAPKRDRLRQLDRFLAAWGIHHLHLGRTDPKTGRARSSDLLYVVFVNDDVFALAARPHRAWLRDELLYVAADNWPGGGPLHASEFVVGLEFEADESERAELFQANVAVPFAHNGRVYAARDNISLVGTSLNAAQWANQTHHDLDRAIARLKQEPEIVVAALRKRFPQRNVGSPTWAITVHNGVFVVTDTTSGAYLLLGEVGAVAGRNNFERIGG